jgi:hypothetical protein
MHPGSAAVQRARRRLERQDQVREPARAGRLVRRRGRRYAQDGGVAGHGRAAGARSRTERGVPFRRAGPDHRTVGRGARLGAPPVRRASAERAHHAAGGRRAAGRARLSGVVRAGGQDRRLARRLRGRVDAGKPDRPRCVHALQRLPRRLPRERDRLHLSGRPPEVQVAPQVRRCLRRDRRDRLLSPRACAQGNLRPRARSFAGAAATSARSAAGLLCAGRRPSAAGACRSEAPGAGGRVREAEVLPLQGAHLRS